MNGSPDRMVLVCASHGWADRRAVESHMSSILADTPGDLTVVTADKTGADRFAAQWAEMHGVTNMKLTTDWTMGRRAPERRNNHAVDVLLDAREHGVDVSMAVFRLPDDARSAELDRVVRVAKAASIHGTLLYACAA